MSGSVIIRTIIIIMGIVNPISSAILNAHAYAPLNTTSTYFSAVIFDRAVPSVDDIYPIVRVFCTGALIAPKWVLTSSNCRLNVRWRILVGVGTVPRYAVHRKTNYGIVRALRSLDGLLTLVEMDRKMELKNVKPARISDYHLNKSSCFVASWMNTEYLMIGHRATNQMVTKQLHCNFQQQTVNVCRRYADQDKLKMRMVDTDICLVQEEPNDPVAFCENDIGAPVVCNGVLVGLVYFIPNVNSTRSGDCYRGKTGRFYPATAISPLIEWINFFTTDYPRSSANSYFNPGLYVSALFFYAPIV